VGAALLGFRALVGVHVGAELGCLLGALITLVVAAAITFATPGGRRSVEDLRQLFGRKRMA
jgi:hypothetical protein